MQLGGSFELGGTGVAPDDLMMVETMGTLYSPHRPPHLPTLHQRTSLRRKTSSSSSDDTGQQLQQQPSSPTKLVSVAIEAGTSSGSGGILSSAAVAPLNPILSTSVSYMYTGKSIIIPYSHKCWWEFNLVRDRHTYTCIICKYRTRCNYSNILIAERQV